MLLSRDTLSFIHAEESSKRRSLRFLDPFGAKQSRAVSRCQGDLTAASCDDVRLQIVWKGSMGAHAAPRHDSTGSQAEQTGCYNYDLGEVVGVYGN